MSRGWAWLLGSTTIAVMTAGIAVTRNSFRDRLPIGVLSSAGMRKTALPAAAELPSSPNDSAWTTAPFRADRSPAPKRYSRAAVDQLALELAERDAAQFAHQATLDSAAQIEAQRPPWTLKGVLLGEPALAVFEGPTWPDGSVGMLSVGTEVEGYAVTTIAEDHVTVSRATLVWTFSLEAPWN